jgi:hypothetical protein
MSLRGIDLNRVEDLLGSSSSAHRIVEYLLGQLPRDKGISRTPTSGGDE